MEQSAKQGRMLTVIFFSIALALLFFNPQKIFAQTGTIDGIITEEGTSTGIANINIMVFDPNNLNSPPLYVRMSDSSGLYSINGLPAGQYILQFCPSPQGGSYLCEWYDNQPSSQSATPVTVAVGLTTTVNAALVKGATINGKITEEGTTTGLPNINIMVFDPNASPPNFFPSYGAMSFSDGSYSITVPPGDYKLQFCPSPQGGSYLCEWHDNAASFQSATAVTATVDTPITINAALAKGATIDGQITEAGTGTGLANINIMVFDPSNLNSPPLYVRMSDSSGLYSINGLPAGQYILQFCPSPQGGSYLCEWYDNQPSSQSATPVTVAVGLTTTVNAALVKGATINGKITEEGTTTVLPNINIMVFDPNASPPNFFPSYGAMSFSDGSYSITVPPGDYKLQFCPSPQGGSYLCEWHDNAASFQTATAVTATVDTPITINAALAKGATISGTITEEGTSTGLPNINILVFDPNNPNFFPISGMSDSNGHYSLVLPSGTYKIYFCPSPMGGGSYLCEWHDNQPSSQSATPVAIAVGLTTTVNAALTKSGTISGTIFEEGTSTGIANIAILAFDPSNPGSSPIDGLSDANGHYSLVLPTGTYKLQFCPSPQGGSYLCEWHDNQPNFQSANPVAVAFGQTTTVNAALAKDDADALNKLFLPLINRP